jgi:hypothetical protein
MFAWLTSRLHIVFGVLFVLALAGDGALAYYAHVTHGALAAAEARCDAAKSADIAEANAAALAATLDAVKADRAQLERRLAASRAAVTSARTAAQQAQAARQSLKQDLNEVYRHDADARRWRDRGLPDAVVERLRGAHGDANRAGDAGGA